MTGELKSRQKKISHKEKLVQKPKVQPEKELVRQKIKKDTRTVQRLAFNKIK